MKSTINSKAVAELAKVSLATVSRVIHDSPFISAETKRTVRGAMQTLGYQPAAPGRRQRRTRSARRTNRIALVVAGLPRAAMNAPVYLDVLHGVEAAVRESGKALMLLHLSSEAASPAELSSQKVDGVVLFGATQDERLIRRLQGTPCVQVMGKIEPRALWDHVSYDNGSLGRIAADYLLGRGHRHAAFISSTRQPFFIERGEVFQRAMAAGGGTCLEFEDPALLDTSEELLQANPERMRMLVDRLLAGNPRPTGVFLAADTLAPGFYAEWQRRGVKAGEDLDVIGCNNERILLAHLSPRPATIDIHAEQVGRKAVERLLWRLDHPREPRMTVALEPMLVPSDGVR